MARHETASSKPNPNTVANIENPAQAEDLDQYGGGWAGSHAARVFEVTNLLIPAGTDWSTQAHVIDTFSTRPVGGLLLTFYLELADLPADNNLQAEVSMVGWGASSAIASLRVDPAKLWVETAPAYSSGLANETGDPTVANPASADLEVRLITPVGPTDVDMTVVSARASIFIF